MIEGMFLHKWFWKHWAVVQVAAQVKAICWTADDFRLVSTGQDGATYESLGLPLLQGLYFRTGWYSA